MDSHPKVSVAMITYRHEKFIAQAIESVLMQRTSFPIELVVGEDCSPDATREIVQSYAHSHPNVIRPILHERNVGMHRNAELVETACRGEYMACLEGDDFWTDEYKLERQIEELERDRSLSFVYHPVTMVREPGHQFVGELPPPERRKKIGCWEDLLEGQSVPTCSVVLRRGLLRALPKRADELAMRDLLNWLNLADMGAFSCINRVMGCYRIQPNGVWSTRTALEKIEADHEMWAFLLECYSGRKRRLIRRALASSFLAELAIRRGGDALDGLIARWFYHALMSRSLTQSTFKYMLGITFPVLLRAQQRLRLAFTKRVK
jgi:glycosyltransferase involved in cell wall biosynthesis